MPFYVDFLTYDLKSRYFKIRVPEIVLLDLSGTLPLRDTIQGQDKGHDCVPELCPRVHEIPGTRIQGILKEVSIETETIVATIENVQGFDF